MNSLTLNYKLLINQIDMTIKQLEFDKEEMIKNYQINYNNNELLHELVTRISNNYQLPIKNDYINSINFKYVNYGRLT